MSRISLIQEANRLGKQFKTGNLLTDIDSMTNELYSGTTYVSVVKFNTYTGDTANHLNSINNSISTISTDIIALSGETLNKLDTLIYTTYTGNTSIKFNSLSNSVLVLSASTYNGLNNVNTKINSLSGYTVSNVNRINSQIISLSGRTIIGNNSGTGTGQIYKNISGNTLNFRNIKAGNNGIIIATVGNDIVISGNSQSNSGILNWNSTTKTFEPYITQQNFLSFDSSNTTPTLTNKLNINGALNATTFNANYHTNTPSVVQNATNGIYGTTNSYRGFGVYGYYTGISTLGAGIFGKSATVGGIGVCGEAGGIDTDQNVTGCGVYAHGIDGGYGLWAESVDSTAAFFKTYTSNPSILAHDTNDNTIFSLGTTGSTFNTGIYVEKSDTITAIFNNKGSSSNDIIKVQYNGVDYCQINTSGINVISGATIKVDGVPMPTRLMGSATLDFPATLAQKSSDLTITVNGAAIGDIVSLGVPNVSVLTNSCYTAWVSAANTVTVRFNNYSSASQDPASGTFKVFVLK